MKTPDIKTFEVGIVILVHAQSVDDARLTLESCMRSDLRVERKEVQYCEETLGRFTWN